MCGLSYRWRWWWWWVSASSSQCACGGVCKRAFSVRSVRGTKMRWISRLPAGCLSGDWRSDSSHRLRGSWLCGWAPSGRSKLEQQGQLTAHTHRQPTEAEASLLPRTIKTISTWTSTTLPAFIRRSLTTSTTTFTTTKDPRSDRTQGKIIGRVEKLRIPKTTLDVRSNRTQVGRASTENRWGRGRRFRLPKKWRTRMEQSQDWRSLGMWRKRKKAPPARGADPSIGRMKILTVSLVCRSKCRLNAKNHVNFVKDDTTVFFFCQKKVTSDGYDQRSKRTTCKLLEKKDDDSELEDKN